MQGFCSFAAQTPHTKPQCQHIQVQGKHLQGEAGCGTLWAARRAALVPATAPGLTPSAAPCPPDQTPCLGPCMHVPVSHTCCCVKFEEQVPTLQADGCSVSTPSWLHALGLQGSMHTTPGIDGSRRALKSASHTQPESTCCRWHTAGPSGWSESPWPAPWPAPPCLEALSPAPAQPKFTTTQKPWLKQAEGIEFARSGWTRHTGSMGPQACRQRTCACVRSDQTANSCTQRASSN